MVWAIWEDAMTEPSAGIPVPATSRDRDDLHLEWCRAMVRVHDLSLHLEAAGHHHDARLVKRALIELSRLWPATTYWDAVDRMIAMPPDRSPAAVAQRMVDQLGLRVPLTDHGTDDTAHLR